MFLFVDLENICDVDLSLLPKECKVRIFVGRTQNSIPFSVTSAAQSFGDRLEWIKIEGDGKNNLDFHLAYYLGRLSTLFPYEEFVVLSRDKGYDPLIRHLIQKKIKCVRADLPPASSPKQLGPEDPHFTRVYEQLTRLGEKNRPQKRKTLLGFTASHTQGKLPPKEIERIVEQFFSKRLIFEVNKLLSYNFPTDRELNNASVSTSVPCHPLDFFLE